MMLYLSKNDLMTVEVGEMCDCIRGLLRPLLKFDYVYFLGFFELWGLKTSLRT